MIAEGELRLRLDRIQSRARCRWRRLGRLPEPGGLVALARAVLPLVPGGLPVLARDCPGLHGSDDAPPPGRRLVGPGDSPADRGGRDDAPAAGIAVPADGPGHVAALSLGRPEEVAARPALQHKSLYLNVGLLPGADRRLLRDLDRPGFVLQPPGPTTRTGPPSIARAAGSRRSAGRASHCCF